MLKWCTYSVGNFVNNLIFAERCTYILNKYTYSDDIFVYYMNFLNVMENNISSFLMRRYLCEGLLCKEHSNWSECGHQSDRQRKGFKSWAYGSN